MKVKKPEDEPFEIMLIPMIDCMLVIIIFFLVATTLKNRENEIPLDLPAAAGAIVSVHQEPNLFVIVVDRNGQPYLNLGAGMEPVTTERLHERIREVAAANPSQRVRVDGDRATRFEDMVRIVDLCAFEGLKNVGLHTRSLNR